MPAGTLPALVALFLFVMGGVVYVARHSLRMIFNWIAVSLRTVWHGVSIKRIRSSKSPHLGSFFSLYESSFSETERFSEVEINEWLDGKAKRNNLDYRLLLAKKGHSILGVAIYIRPKQSNIVYVPYLGLSQEAAATRVSQKVIERMLRSIQPGIGKRNIVLFEVDDPDEPGLRPAESNRRQARIRHFANLCNNSGICIRYPELTYWQPPYHTDRGDREGRTLHLGILPSRRINTISREELLNSLRVIYEIYEVCISDGEPRKEEIVAQIKRRLDRYASLPSSVRLLAVPAR